MKVTVTLMIIEDLMIDEGPLTEEEDIMIGVEDHRIEVITKIEVILGEEGPLMIEDPLEMEDPLMMEDPQGMEEIQDALEDEEHQAPQDLLDL